MAEHIVKVWNKECTVTAQQRSKTVWVALGEYHGERFEVTGRSEATAVAKWRETAKYKGN